MNNEPGNIPANEPTTVGAGVANEAGTTTASQPTVVIDALPAETQQYLKGLGISSLDEDSIKKIIDAGMKQKQSVAKKSQELEELKAKYAGVPVEATQPEPVVPQPTAPQEPSTPVAQGQTQSLTDNELFMLSDIIRRDFPELTESATDGSLFKEMRQLGYFNEGLNLRATTEYLAGKHAIAKELKELRAFKAAQESLDPEDNPGYNPYSSLSNTANKDVNWANNVLAAAFSGQDVSAEVYQEAVRIKQSSL